MSPCALSNSAAKKFDSRDDERRSPWQVLARVCRRALPQHARSARRRAAALLVCAACTRACLACGCACLRCALPALGGAVCGACLARPPPFDAAFAAFAYAFPLDRLLHAFKYGGRLSHADYFAEALSETVAQRPAGTTGPTRWSRCRSRQTRQRERGFDQAAEIARRVARITGVAMTGGLRRTRDTPAQAALPWQDRAKQRSRRVRRRNLRCRHAHRHRRRRDDHGRDARVRGRRVAARRRPRRRGLGGRAYTSAGTTSMKARPCSPWFWSTPKFRRTPAT